MSDTPKAPLTRRIAEMLRRPLFGTRVIPREARVDPALFPEEEFPIYCGRCGYNLRGLPDGPCPECGTPFDRGRDLVLSYVRFPLGKWWKTSSGRWLIRFLIVGMMAVALELGRAIPYWFLLWRAEQTGGPPPKYGGELTAALWYAAYAFQVIGFLAVCCCIFVMYRGFRQIADKRRRILAAISDDASGGTALLGPGAVEEPQPNGVGAKDFVSR